MHEMDAATLDELRTLRARAYGPSADIDQDPAALQRLHELEARRGTPDAEVVVPSAPPALAEPAPALDAVPVPPPSDEDEVALLTPPEGSEPEAVRPRRTRRVSSQTWALWVLSVLAAAALAAGLTSSLISISPVSASSGAPQIDTLEPDPFVVLPDGFMGAGPSSLAFEYYGVTLFETAGGYGGVGTDCFSVVPTEQIPETGTETDGWSMSGLFYTGCRVGAFPATVQFAVDSAVPQQLRDRFPPDSALQFVFDGDRIGVYLDSTTDG
ncbi:hypothetical protein MRBLWH7_002515 [Microbacterium sp. LWH7-1.2]|uniref:hypothetical protein n=1 Tax=Microbacterium sp. LWH7-1.2 TaxID=3135257 RepID=UPI0031388D8F